jgi:hypothetical protein
VADEKVSNGFNPFKGVEMMMGILERRGENPFIKAVETNNLKQFDPGSVEYEINLMSGAEELLNKLEAQPGGHVEYLAACRTKVLGLLFQSLGVEEEVISDRVANDRLVDVEVKLLRESVALIRLQDKWYTRNPEFLGEAKRLLLTEFYNRLGVDYHLVRKRKHWTEGFTEKK